MSNIPTGGVLINDLPKVSSLKATDSLIVARDGLAYTGSVGSIGEATTATVSDAFSENIVYPAGSYCIYNDTLYRFTVDKSAGAWDDSVVVATNVGTEMSTSTSDISQLNSALAEYIVTDCYRETTEFDVEANSTTTVSLSVPYRDGYECIGCFSSNTGNNNLICYICYNSDIPFTSFSYAVRNISSSNITTSARYITFIYRKKLL